MTDLPVSLLPIGVGLCLSAACGFRTFLPLLFVGAAARWGIFPLNGQFEWIASTPGLVVLLSATIAEIVAYFVPFVDNASDVIATPLAIGAGTLMMLTSLGDSSGVIPWALAIILGGGTSGIVQAATVKLRALSSGTTAGTGNAVVAGGELVSASTFSLVALFLPVIAFIVALILLVIVVRVLMRAGNRVRSRGTPSV
ncbi:MAG TPA: DUF4126 domain-containing protein [Gemmatimonas sp.]|nr:DUF4126 domain-containing protein [Gemmatimonas sp.]